jgi:hypothetical protein
MKILFSLFIILITYSDCFSQVRESITVKAGWNLIGSLSTGAITSVVSTTPSNIISSRFYRFNNQTQIYETASNVEAGESYWVNFSQNGKLYFSRPKQSSIDTINVYNGWNSFGSISNGSVSVLVSTSPPGLLNSPFYKFDALTGLLISTYELTRGAGYWVDVKQNGKLIIQTTVYGQQNDDTSRVQLTFSEPMSRAGIFNVSNYLVLKDLVTPVQVYKVGIADGDKVVVLFTEKYSPSSTYKVIVNNVYDRAGNLINREFNFAFY